MNQGLVRQINDIVRPYRKARMGLLIAISNPVGRSGPTPPLTWDYMELVQAHDSWHGVREWCTWTAAGRDDLICMA